MPGVVSDFYKNLRSLCEEQDMTVNEVVKALDLSSDSPTAWKNGVVPRYATILKIASYFNVSTDLLLHGSALNGNMTLSEEEDSLIRKYRNLTDHSKALVQLVIDHELKR